MSRKYKANRARGTRQSKYATKYELGFALPKIKDFRGVDQYIKEFIRLNEKEVKEAYKRKLDKVSIVTGEEGVTRFKQFHPTLESFVKGQFTKNQIKNFSVKTVRSVVSNILAPTSLKQMKHLLNLISRDEDFYEEFKLRANEEIDVNRIIYTKDNTYRYTTKTGKIIKFMYLDYSPTRLVFFGEEKDE